EEGSLPVLLAHELGHVFGLDHAEDEASLMSPRLPSGTDNWSVTGDAVAALDLLTGHC
ncbi:MAG: matrixin family metalloprotease, partial [Actinomycetia bacterium]|nr:matrixin family metalloprotease [Actinomycetes bacterium]